jgi:hypothetical protein
VIRPGPQSAFQFIPKVFDVVEVRALYRPVKFFHTDEQPIFVWTSLCAQGHCRAETGKGLLQTVDTKLDHRIL